MKKVTIASLAALALFLMMSASAFAGSKDGGSTDFELRNQADVSGTTLAPGTYKLRWEGAGPEVHVQFTQGKKVLATTTAKVVELNSKDSVSAAVLDHSASGAPALSEARLSGKRFKLVFDTASEASAKHAQSNGGGSQQ
jgi:hypothetical protein